MAKKVEFSPAGPDAAGGFPKVTNPDGESDVRMGMKDAPEKGESQADAAARKMGNLTEHEKDLACDDALAKLKSLAGLVSPKKDDDLVKPPFNLHRVHIGMIREMASWLAKGKKFSLSDGNCEMLSVVYAKLKKSGVIK